MFFDGPRNNHYLELYGASARALKASPAGFNNGHTLEMMADFRLLAFGAGVVANVAFAGADDGPGWFEYDAPAANTVRTATARFGAIRNGVTKRSGNGTLYLGRRHVLYGRDNGENVEAWLDDTALGSATSQADWTAAQLAYPVTAPSTLYVGYDTSANLYTKLKLYEFWVKLGGAVVVHWRPKLHMENGDSPLTVTLEDLSPFDNDGSAGGLEAEARIRRAWNEGSHFAARATQ